MMPATTAPDPRDATRLLVVRPDRALLDTRVRELPSLLARGDALVVNDAATLPASLHGVTARGEPIELRLFELEAQGRGRGVLLGAGDFRTKTEHRPAPPTVHEAELLSFGELRCRVLALDPLSPRLLELAFEGEPDTLWAALYRRGRLVQYAYHPRPLPLHALQTVYGGRPWAAEMPSAGRPLSWSVLLELRRRGVQVLALTHGAGLSATGDPTIDAALPLRERFDLPQVTVDSLEKTRVEGGRVIAVGTSVVRALEGNVQLHGGELRASSATTDLVLDAGFERRVTDGLLTGMHEPAESHFRLLRAFASSETLARAHAHATRAGYRSHELGDSMLLLP